MTDTVQQVLDWLRSDCAGVAHVLKARRENLLDDERRHKCRVFPQTPDESLECRVPGLAHIVRPVRPSDDGDVDVPHVWGEQGRLSSVVGALRHWRLDAARRSVVQWRTSGRSSRSCRRDAGGVGTKMCHPGRHVRQWQRCRSVWRRRPRYIGPAGQTRPSQPDTVVTSCMAAISKSVTMVVGSALKPSDTHTSVTASNISM